MEDVMEGTEPDYLCTPEQALHDVAHAETPVLVDFDETLCLRNSTEEFIDQAMFGLLALLRIPVQLKPDVSKPVITVETRWPGASPQEIEKEIIDRQEEQLKSIAGMTEFKSESHDGRGRIVMEFAVGTDMLHRYNGPGRYV